MFFFENGIVSLNLPPVSQVVGARATRTTHPQTLAGFRRILSEALREPFDVSNPYAWITKSEVIQRIAQGGCANLIRHTRSCARVHAMTKLHPHCGECSQCIDRRFAVLATGLEQEDPEEAYKVDLLLGSRGPGPDREMALAHVRSASKISQMTDIDFFTQYGETTASCPVSQNPQKRWLSGFLSCTAAMLPPSAGHSTPVSTQRSKILGPAACSRTA
jgi:hypothetical protein